MLKTLTEMLSLPWVGTTVALICAVVGASWAVSRVKRRSMAFRLHEVEALSTNRARLTDNLIITYRGAPLTQMTAADIFVWNDGNDPIEAAAFVVDAPARFELIDGGEILEARINRATREGVNAEIPPDCSGASIPIEFAFLEPGDGFIVSLLHTGAKDSIEFRGTLRGLPKGIVNKGRLVDGGWRWGSLGWMVASALAGASIGLIPTDSTWSAFAYAAALLILTCAVGFFIAFTPQRRMMKMFRLNG